MGGSKTVLVVDDEPEILDLMAEFLPKLGCEVLLARDGEEAIRVFRAERPPLIITDLRMPKMDGLTLMSAIKEASPRTEILIITAHADLGSAIQAVRQGAFDYLPKPFDLEILGQRVNRALERHRLVSEKEVLLEDLKRANQALREAQAQLVEKERLAAVGQVVVGLHHAILNPLAGILGALQVLKQEELAPTAKAEAFAQAEAEIRKIEQLIRRLPALRQAAGIPYVGDTTMLDLERPGGEEEQA